MIGKSRLSWTQFEFFSAYHACFHRKVHISIIWIANFVRRVAIRTGRPGRWVAGLYSQSCVVAGANNGREASKKRRLLASEIGAYIIQSNVST